MLSHRSSWRIGRGITATGPGHARLFCCIAVAVVLCFASSTWVNFCGQDASQSHRLARGTHSASQRLRATVTDKPPELDYPPAPPAASIAWPRYLAWLGATIVAVQGIRRKLFGGAEAVALDPALPITVRLELIYSRAKLRSQAKGSPRAFRSALRETADTLEEVPALLVTVAVLVGDALRSKGQGLSRFRRLGEAQALLFTAGRLHLGMADGAKGAMRLLGGDFLYAEGQWILAELGSLPAIKMTSRMIRDFSDSCSKGGTAEDEKIASKSGELGLRDALTTAFMRTGTFFATTASTAAWLSGASPEAIRAMHRYGSDLGCALSIAQHNDVASQDAALWLARGASQALDVLGDSPALRGLRRLAHRVERSCARKLRRLLRHTQTSPRGFSFGEFRETLSSLEAFSPDYDEKQSGDIMPSGCGFSRSEASERELQALISAGLEESPLEAVAPFTWPEEGPKAALQGAMQCIGRELVGVNASLDGGELANPAVSDVVRTAVIELFGAGGKRLRPALVLLVARALGSSEADLGRVCGLAKSVEVLHGASLVHDDILDGADQRRGKETVHRRVGERAAALAGDFLFGQASVFVADLESIPTVLLISKVIADFGRGELAQSAVKFEAVEYSLTDYLAKSFYKTASLLAAACQAAAVLSGASPESSEASACYRFGAFVGLAFQVVDDVLDFTSTSEELGKPALADLRDGNLSAPVLYAARTGALSDASRAELVSALERRIVNEGDLDLVLRLVNEANGVGCANALARRFIDLAALELEHLPESEARHAMRVFAEFTIARKS